MSSQNINDSLHSDEYLKSGDFFLRAGKPCTKIGKLIQGVMRGFVHDQEGEEVTTHFYQEGDMIVGSYMPNVNVSMNIQALEDCEISVADYSAVISQLNKDPQITEVVNREFLKLNERLQSRLVSLLNLSSADKYRLFLKEYPGLLNRIPHYYIAQYLGITPTQLSRVRKQLSQQM